MACSYATAFFNSSASVNAQATSSWSCSATQRTLSSNGIKFGPGTSTWRIEALGQTAFPSPLATPTSTAA